MRKYGLRFEAVETASEIDQLAEFLRNHPGTYAGELHEKWIDEVCIPGVESGNRRAVAWYQHDEMIGDAVIKAAGQNTAELKNFRVDKFTHRGAADFLLRQAIFEAQEVLDEQGQIATDANTFTIKLDTAAGSDAERFFAYQGFVAVAHEQLYVPGQNEVIMELTVPLH